MGDRPKIDLKNGHVGGQPKDWLDRASEPSELGAKEWGLILTLVASVGVTLWGLLKLAVWLLSR